MTKCHFESLSDCGQRHDCREKNFPSEKEDSPLEYSRGICHDTTLGSAGVLGIKVKIMLPHDPTGKSGPKKPLPDQVRYSALFADTPYELDTSLLPIISVLQSYFFFQKREHATITSIQLALTGCSGFL